MASTLRTFIGIRIATTPAVRDVLQTLGEMGRSVRPVKEESLHITLKFLGETQLEQVPVIAEKMCQAASTATGCEGILRGLGAFPSVHRPNVIWAGIEPREALAGLAADLDQRMDPLGFPSEGREFRPHVTLAFVKDRPTDGLRGLLCAAAVAELGRAPIREVEFFQSHLGPSGSTYLSLARSDFGH